MSAQYIGYVVAPSGKKYDVKRDSYDRIVYVSYAGWSNIGKANSDQEALAKARSFLIEKGA